jgi:transcription termination factor Rho
MGQKLGHQTPYIKRSDTHREDLLIEPERPSKIWMPGQLLDPMDDLSAIEFMFDEAKNTKSNNELFNSMKR